MSKDNLQTDTCNLRGKFLRGPGNNNKPFLFSLRPVHSTAARSSDTQLARFCRAIPDPMQPMHSAELIGVKRNPPQLIINHRECVSGLFCSVLFLGLNIIRASNVQFLHRCGSNLTNATR